MARQVFTAPAGGRALARVAMLPAEAEGAGDPAPLLAEGMFLASQLTEFMASGDAQAAGNWLRRLAREPSVNPWLLIDQLAGSGQPVTLALINGALRC